MILKPGQKRKARDLNPHFPKENRLSSAARRTVSGYLPVSLLRMHKRPWMFAQNGRNWPCECQRRNRRWIACLAKCRSHSERRVSSSWRDSVACMPPSPQVCPCSTYSRNEAPVSRVR